MWDPSQCLDDHGHCRKGFPKSFSASTALDEGGYPTYCYCNSGRRVEKSGKQLDNWHVVPYNPHVLVCLGFHVNVELCANMYAGE